MAVPTSTTTLVSQSLSRNRNQSGDADVCFHGLSVEGAGQGVCLPYELGLWLKINDQN